MRGRQILIEPLPKGGHAAALMVDGRLEDLLVDPDPADPTPRPEAIFRAIPARPMKGLGGVMLDLGAGRTGFLRGPKLPAPGRSLLVQVTGVAEPGKAQPVSARPILKARHAILTPGAPGINVARSLRDPDRRAALEALGTAAMAGAEADLGLILRTAAIEAPDDRIAADIAALRAEWAGLAPAGAPGLLRPAPGARDEALREWREPGDPVRDAPTAFTEAGIWDEIDALRRPEVPLAGGGFMAIEPTRALVAVDVNTGGDTSPAAGLKANLAAATELPRQLRLRGLGGQIVVDFAPMPRPERVRVERALAHALRTDGIDTTLVGWSPLGHLELQRKRARQPLASVART
ncbi:MAG: ribonuclease E/G [Amaricoccus sp.]|uniref:ribonuclease E/G n=1 Tax=Amaricoccus sp. TaxID=1872485 RepID=UPI0039E45518